MGIFSWLRSLFHFSPKGPSLTEQLVTTLNRVLDDQIDERRMVFKAVSEMVEGINHQSSALQAYLKLFNSNDTPTSWTFNPTEEASQAYVEQGFPTGGTEQEQAAWILADAGRM